MRGMNTLAASTLRAAVHHHGKLKYRPDIDGLRAIAVLSVFGFHLQMGTFSGGFVGVDIFFVLSGYLIGSILLSDLESGRFSLREFYVRRIRRIFPALVVALLGTVVLALVFSMPSELRDFAKSLIAATFSASNIYFGLHSNYFDLHALERPALQTWSLGVEEQFYLLFPPLLLLLHRRFPRQLTATLVLLTAVSFALSAFGAFRFPILTFFMPYTRAWELLCGTLLALPLMPRLRSLAVRNLLAFAGLLLIAFAIRLFNAGMPFPGAAALFPCVGTALLLWSGQPLPDPTTQTQTLPARLLSTRPLVFIGLISYSLYLLHWPIVAFQSMGGLWGYGLPHRVSSAITFVVSLVLATLSWRFVERPFRDGKLKLTGSHAFWFAGVSVAVLVACGGTALALHGLPGRFSPEAIRVAGYVDEPMNFRIGTCMVIRASDFNPGVCLREDPTRQNWLLIGDSHAAALWAGLVAALPDVNILQANRAACHPDPAQTGGECGILMQEIFNGFLATHHVDRIVAVSRWTADDVGVVDRLLTWSRAHRIPVTLIGPTQEYDAPLPRLLAFGILRHDPGFAYRHRSLNSAKIDALFQRDAETRWHVPYISLVGMFCSPSTCATYVAGKRSAPLMSDEDHFTNEASLLVGRRAVADHLLGAAAEPAP
jgi:peptidoglycan/LPS O-acetylase OafA/YrhL